MSDSLPDILGMITGGPRYIAGMVQCAAGIYPSAIAVGQTCELLLLMQNACDKPIQVGIRVYLPRRDSEGNHLSLLAGVDTLQVTLQTVEVGLLHIPISVLPPTSPHPNIPIALEIAVRAPRGARIVRVPEGGRPASKLSLSPFRVAALRDVRFRAGQREDGALQAVFNIIPGQLDGPKPTAPYRYETLWSMRELAQEKEHFAQLRARAEQFVATFGKAPLLDPLVRTTTARFANAGYPLHPAEARFIAKLLCYVVGDGLEDEPGFSRAESRWFNRLTTIIEDQGLLTNLPALLEYLYTALVHDAVRLGLVFVTRAANLDLGTPAEQEQYASEVVASLEAQQGMDLAHVYVPLVPTGLYLNLQFVSKNENPWISLFQLREAWRGRVKLAGNQLGWIDDLMQDSLYTAEQDLVKAGVQRPEKNQ